MHVPACVLPVLDIKGGQVVHAVAGRRSAYQPLISRWTSNAHDPFRLTAVFQVRFGLSEYYLADLDALERQGSNLGIINGLIYQGCRLWLDAGIRSVEEASAWLNADVHRLVIASESIPSISLLEQLARSVDCERLVFSLDLVAGQVQCQSNIFGDTEPLRIVERITAFGISQFIVLDIAAVGTSQGPATAGLCRAIKDQFPGCTIISGGGVRGLKDIEQLQQSGVDRVLVSTWLHAEPTTNAALSSALPVR